ncbi:hypothetical protein DCM91_13155 [Chitinophaga costaii]|nr:hypothetical protein DCM91_13155 [Chitinophaga costaii]
MPTDFNVSSAKMQTTQTIIDYFTRKIKLNTVDLKYTIIKMNIHSDFIFMFDTTRGPSKHPLKIRSNFIINICL